MWLLLGDSTLVSEPAVLCISETAAPSALGRMPLLNEVVIADPGEHSWMGLETQSATSVAALSSPPFGESTTVVAEPSGACSLELGSSSIDEAGTPELAGGVAPLGDCCVGLHSVELGATPAAPELHRSPQLGTGAIVPSSATLMVVSSE